MSARSRRFPLPLARVGAHGVEAARRDLARARPTASADALPRGLGLDSQAVRDRMVARLRADGIRCEPVLAAMARVPRHAFVDAALVAQAYEDTALPIGLGQTISQPFVVAKMTEALLTNFCGEKLLEIGTGCGYQTAVLSPLVKKIYSVERLPELLRKTRQRLRELDIYNVQFRPGDGWEGWPKYGPYDGIIVTAAATELPEKLLQQLAPGGRMVIPVGPPGRQALLLVTRMQDHFEQVSLGAVSFVPLVQG